MPTENTTDASTTDKNKTEEEDENELAVSSSPTKNHSSSSSHPLSPPPPPPPPPSKSSSTLPQPPSYYFSSVVSRAAAMTTAVAATTTSPKSTVIGWKRSVVKRFENFLDQAVAKSGETTTTTIKEGEGGLSFFCNHLEHDDVARLRRSEVCIDRYIATGSFCDVFQVSGFDFLFDNDSDSDIDFLPEQQMARRKLQQLAADSTQRFVIKNVRRSLESEPQQLTEALSSLVMEAKFLARLNHDNILKLRGYSWQEGRKPSSATTETDETYDDDCSFFIILDRVHSTLSDQIKEWKNEGHNYTSSASSSIIGRSGYGGVVFDLYYFEERLRYALEIANALQYLHERRIIYRDLKPHNIGISTNNHIQIFDFGLAKELPHPSMSFGIDERYQMTCAGTRRYMAPEILRKQGYNLKADVYSWTMVVWEMLALKQPYEDYNKDLHYLLVCEEGIRPRIDNNERWPVEISRLLEMGWAHSLAERFDMQQIVGRLSSILTMIDDGERNVLSPSSSPSSIRATSRETSSPSSPYLPFRSSSDEPSTGSSENDNINPNTSDNLTLTDCSSFSIESDDTLSHVHDHHEFHSVNL